MGFRVVNRFGGDFLGGVLGDGIIRVLRLKVPISTDTALINADKMPISTDKVPINADKVPENNLTAQQMKLL